MYYFGLSLLFLVSGAAGFALLQHFFSSVPISLLGALAGILLGVLVDSLTRRLRHLPARTLLGAATGILGGLLLLALTVALIPAHLRALPAYTFVQLLALAGFAYCGAALGARKGEEFSLEELAAPLLRRGSPGSSPKVLDTSVIIDGRIADVCDTGFIEGTLVVPQFVLRELQHIADSPNTLKRNRGRRGLDILQVMQKKPNVEVKISDLDFPRLREVDSKLIEAARALKAPIVTNDFNLNKVAELNGVPVLNINELTNALKPVVLPGELMNVHVLREGKEANQGVAYLDDGTMVVVDNARRFIGSNVEVTVTSVLQTAAGRMIFTQLKADVPPETSAVEAGSSKT